MGARVIHVHYGVHWLLELTDKELLEHVTHPDGAEAARKELNAMIDDGETCFVLDSSCDNKKPDGSCAGHPIKEQD
ncbi:hypothetical protein FMH15_16925 [Vibrio alginolyticus]|uniref:hypothetical protein n=1 Tax=Vibrio sp. 378 TaxID=3074603 RepID=UPI0028941B63|nr:hypothetical protein [Vibrio sp. 378]EGR0268314.1 hypothetical protein [Vibrio alginolyticus]ELH9641282.1 hypothetical protein [Vibrio alginolyticus]MDW2149432.1 hypothetical protein [Vibrio sp. 378]